MSGASFLGGRLWELSGSWMLARISLCIVCSLAFCGLACFGHHEYNNSVFNSSPTYDYEIGLSKGSTRRNQLVIHCSTQELLR